jgi:hypothetical protein
MKELIRSSSFFELNSFDLDMEHILYLVIVGVRVRSDLHGRYSSAYTYLAVAATVLSRDRCMDAGPGERAASLQQQLGTSLSM